MITAPYVQDDGVIAEQPEDELWIRSGDNVTTTARDIEDFLLDFPGNYLDLACIGAGAVNQAVKSIAVARENLGSLMVETSVVVQPYFSNIIDDQGRKRTRMMLRVSLYAS